METVTIRIGEKTEFQKADELIRPAREAEQARETASAKIAAEKPANPVERSIAMRTRQHPKAGRRAIAKTKAARTPEAVSLNAETATDTGD